MIIGAVVLCLGGYYAYYFLLGGKERAAQSYRDNMGLWEGEDILALFNAYYALEKKLGKDIALGAVGMQRNAMHLKIGLTSRNRMVIGYEQNDSPPQGYEPDQVRVSDSPRPRKQKTLAGPSGLEKTETIMIETPDGVNHYEVPGGAAQAIRDWAQAGHPAHPM